MCVCAKVVYVLSGVWSGLRAQVVCVCVVCVYREPEQLESAVRAKDRAALQATVCFTA